MPGVLCRWECGADNPGSWPRVVLIGAFCRIQILVLMRPQTISRLVGRYLTLGLPPGKGFAAVLQRLRSANEKAPAAVCRGFEVGGGGGRPLRTCINSVERAINRVRRTYIKESVHVWPTVVPVDDGGCLKILAPALERAQRPAIQKNARACARARKKGNLGLSPASGSSNALSVDPRQRPKFLGHLQLASDSACRGPTLTSSGRTSENAPALLGSRP